MRRIQEHLKELVEDAKALRGRKKKDIAKALSISPQQLSNLLSGHADWSASHIENLCATAGVHFYWPPNENSEHENLHHKLETILDAGEPYALGIQVSIEAIYKEIIDIKESRSSKIENSPGTDKKPPLKPRPGDRIIKVYKN